MSWGSEDHAKAWRDGFAIGTQGTLFSTKRGSFLTHEIIYAKLDTMANAGNEFAARAIAETIRRRMTK